MAKLTIAAQSGGVRVSLQNTKDFRMGLGG